jgi:hypothetical protein
MLSSPWQTGPSSYWVTLNGCGPHAQISLSGMPGANVRILDDFYVQKMAVLLALLCQGRAIYAQKITITLR